jgi:hypothetical protein
MRKQAQLATITIVLLAASTAGGVYLWWQSTPQFALVEARKGYTEKESNKFNKYVDVAGVTTGFTEEIIFVPAEKTPKLTKLQRVIGLGALHAARTGIDNSLIFQIQKLVKKCPAQDHAVVSSSSSDSTESVDGKHLCAGSDDTADGVKPVELASTANGGTLADQKVEKQALGKVTEQVENVEHKPRGFATLVRMQWRKEKERLKHSTFERMSEFARKHPNTLINRIFAAPTGGRANAVKAILAECGFRASNFKKYKLEKRGSFVIAHLTFHSPRINDLVTVKLELERLRQGPFGRYRISRLVDFKSTLNRLNYNTDEQIQGLVAYGLQDLNGQTIASKAKAVMRELGESVRAAEEDSDDDDNDDREVNSKSAMTKSADRSAVLK